MAFANIKVPQEGTKITVKNNQLVVSDHPILAFIEGDGIGPDITKASKRIWDAAVQAAYRGQRKISWMEIYAGEKAAQIYDGNYMPEETFEAIKEFIVAIKGPLTTPVGGGFRSLNVTLRQVLDLYACIRPVRWFQGIPSPVREPHQVDMIIFRENTEDVYAGIEYEDGTEENEHLAKFLRVEMGANFFEGAGIGIKPISPFGTKRLVRKAIQYAIDNGRDSVTLVHKGNIQKFTEGAFQKWGYEVAAEEFGDITLSENDLWSQYNGQLPDGDKRIIIKDRIADIMFQLALLRPTEFEVVATTNLNGDYLSDALAAQVGGVGIAPGANIADHVALFEATHGTAPKYANQNKVNPCSLMLSGVMMLDYIGWKEAGQKITTALEQTIRQRIVTYDFARQMAQHEDGVTQVGTAEFADAIISNM